MSFFGWGGLWRKVVWKLRKNDSFQACTLHVFVYPYHFFVYSCMYEHFFASNHWFKFNWHWSSYHSYNRFFPYTFPPFFLFSFSSYFLHHWSRLSFSFSSVGSSITSNHVLSSHWFIENKSWLLTSLGFSLVKSTLLI